MSEIMLVRQPHVELSENDREVLRRALFGFVDGLGEKGKRQWRRFWGRIFRMEPGEMMRLANELPRSGPFHRRHFLIEQTLFDAQERFTDFEQYLYWIKVGAGWVTWAAGPKGGVVPIPNSISYALADQEEFERFHEKTMAFLRGDHAAPYLWPQIPKDQAHAGMDRILSEFNE